MQKGRTDSITGEKLDDGENFAPLHKVENQKKAEDISSGTSEKKSLLHGREEGINK